MKRKNKITIGVILAIFLVGILAFNLRQTAFPGGTYVQAPTFYYYECAPASQPVESNHVVMTTGASGWIIIPSNTDTADLWIRQTEQTKWYSNDRRMIFQVCHNGGANCDPQVTANTGSSWWQLGPNGVPSVHIPNLLTTDKVFVNYQYQNLLFQWKDQANGAEWYHTYKPFILWKVDMFGGGRTEYTSINQGCNFQSNDVNNLISSVTNIVKQINTQTTTSNTNVPFYKTRNFIGTYVPISTANVNFVTYGGQAGYCLQRQVFAITTVNTNGGTYQIVDNNFNTRLANSVDCCPGETEPTRKCNANFGWDPITQAECSAFSACAGADWAVGGSKSLIRYNCVNSKCVAETKAVACTSNADCGTQQVCDTGLYQCINVNPGTVTCLSNQTLVNGICVDNTANTCKWYQDPYAKNSYKSFLGFKYGEPVVNSGCQTSGLAYVLIIVGAITILIIVYMVSRPRYGSRRRYR